MSSNDVDCTQNEKWLVVGEVSPSPHNKWNHLRATNNTLMMLMLITKILTMLIMMKSLVVRGSPSPHNKWNHWGQQYSTTTTILCKMVHPLA